MVKVWFRNKSLVARLFIYQSTAPLRVMWVLVVNKYNYGEVNAVMWAVMWHIWFSANGYICMCSHSPIATSTAHSLGSNIIGVYMLWQRTYTGGLGCLGKVFLSNIHQHTPVDWDVQAKDTDQLTEKLYVYGYILIHSTCGSGYVYPRFLYIIL